mgnify:FL=1
MLKELKTITIYPNKDITGKEFSDDCKRRKTAYQQDHKQEHISVHNSKPKIRIIARHAT